MDENNIIVGAFDKDKAWDVAIALKSIFMAGRVEEPEEELRKAENYLHHARTGEWIGEESRNED